ncbi:MAG: tetratricopeptide repeat-containing sulfotransferase family protein [Luteimonas sp.]
MRQGFQLLREGRLAEAIRLSDQLLASDGNSAEVLSFDCEVRLAAGDAEAALRSIDAAICAAGDQAELLTKKARILLQLRRRTEARRVAAEAATAAGDDGRALWAVGRVYGDCNDPLHALDIYERALVTDRGNLGLRFDLAAIQFFAGDFASAETTLDKLIADAPRIGHAFYLRSTLRRQTDACSHVSELRTRLRAGFADEAEHAACFYALAKELEDLGHDDSSFAALSEGARRKRGTLRYAAADERKSIDGIRAAYTAEVMQSATTGHPDRGAIFVVGMPRTGTTLMERTLGRHSAVCSAGELLDFGRILGAAARASQVRDPDKTMIEASLALDFAALGRDYMRGAREAAHGSRVFVDKMPVNFLYCGLIKKALPNARLIHLVRDPMDSCYAVYKTLFHQAYHFSYDLDELADYYATYRRLMQHWHEVMPGMILDVQYEELVTDLERQVRRILDWCGLDWEASVLNPSQNDQPSITASAAQVRETVYTSSMQKWRRHEAGLASLRTRLMAAGIVATD